MSYASRRLFGLFAGITVIAPAEAADFRATTAAPVEFVRVCSTYGAAFFHLPGTDTCLRVGGRVRTEASYTDPANPGTNALSFRARGRVNVDTRTPTPYGLLRSYIRYEVTKDSATLNRSDGSINENVSPRLRQAFVQFGGLTAGRVVSFFSNPDLPAPHFGDLRYDDPSIANVNLFAYTFGLGSGFSATIAAEDGIERRADAVEPLVALAPRSDVFAYGGQSAPDVVGNLRWKGTWGSLQLSGALHQIPDVGTAATLDAAGIPIRGTRRPSAGTDYGWAAAFQGTIDVPVAGVTDNLWWFIGYTQGAVGYIGFNSIIAGSSASAGRLSVGTPDAVVNAVTNEIVKADGFSTAAGFTHYWVPTVQTNLFGSFSRIAYPGVASAIDPIGRFVIGFPDVTEWRLGTNTIWTPVAGLDIGVEVLYIDVEPQGPVLTRGTPDNPRLLQNQESQLQTRFRVQRDF